MLVCANGLVDEFCAAHGMVVVEFYEGEIGNYNGVCRVLVTDQDISKNEYCFLKGKLLAAGVELVSTKHLDDSELLDFVTFTAIRERQKKQGGRNRFGFYSDNGEVKLHETGRAVLKRIFELRDAGHTYRTICDDDGVHHLDGRKLSISTVQIILQNREKYEKEGL